MAKYEWDLISLRNNIILLKELEQKISKDEENKVKENINTYNMLIKLSDVRASNNFNEDDCFKEYSLASFIKDYLPTIDKNKIFMVEKAINVVKKYYNLIKAKENEEVILPTMAIDNDTLIEITREIFKRTNIPFLINEYDKIINSKDNLLHIKHYKKINLEDNLGRTYIDTLAHKAYGIIARDNSLNDIITLAHECCHMMLCRNVPYTDNNSSSLYYEVEGYWMDLVTCNILKTMFFDKGTVDLFNLFDLEIVLDSIINSYITLEIVNNTKDNNVNFKSLNQKLKSNRIYNINFNDNDDCLDFTTEEFDLRLDDTISYLVALDLYKNYLIDPEKTFYHLQKVPFFSGDNPIKELDSINVTFYRDDYSNLDKHCKKLKKYYS